MGLTKEEQREKARRIKKEETLRDYESGIIKNIEALDRGIYFLHFNNHIVYIGMSEDDVMQRISAHKSERKKIFDSFSYTILPNATKRDLLKKEKSLIKKHKPHYNETHHPDKKKPKKRRRAIREA